MVATATPGTNTKSTGGSPAPTTPPPPTTEGAQVRKAATSGGTARFSYTKGYVDLLELQPGAGYTWEAYRLANDYVAVRFTSYYHVSTIYAYWSTNKMPCIVVYEETY